MENSIEINWQTTTTWDFFGVGEIKVIYTII